jgi:predicted transcriptional regulator YdeE
MTHSSFELIGLRLKTKTSNQNGQSMQDCGNLWQEFETQELAQAIPNKLNEAVYAVYFDYESDHTGAFNYFVGCRVKSGTEAPEGLSKLAIPEQTYALIQAKGKMPDCMADSWKNIWSSDLKRAYTFDFEVYDERSHNWEQAEVDIFVAVR